MLGTIAGAHNQVIAWACTIKMSAQPPITRLYNTPNIHSVKRLCSLKVTYRIDTQGAGHGRSRVNCVFAAARPPSKRRERLSFACAGPESHIGVTINAATCETFWAKLSKPDICGVISL